MNRPQFKHMAQQPEATLKHTAKLNYNSLSAQHANVPIKVIKTFVVRAANVQSSYKLYQHKLTWVVKVFDKNQSSAFNGMLYIGSYVQIDLLQTVPPQEMSICKLTAVKHCVMRTGRLRNVTVLGGKRFVVNLINLWIKNQFRMTERFVSSYILLLTK